MLFGLSTLFLGREFWHAEIFGVTLASVVVVLLVISSQIFVVPFLYKTYKEMPNKTQFLHKFTPFLVLLISAVFIVTPKAID